MRGRYLAMLLILPALLAQSGNGMSNSQGRARGKKSGAYSLHMVGDFTGKGTASVTAATVSLSADVTFPDGSRGTILFSNLDLVNDRFQGAATANGRSLKISGRVDLPSATDDQQTASQVVTGRVLATLCEDGTGNTGRLVAIQDAASRGGNGNANGLSQN